MVVVVEVMQLSNHDPDTLSTPNPKESDGVEDRTPAVRYARCRRMATLAPCRRPGTPGRGSRRGSEVEDALGEPPRRDLAIPLVELDADGLSAEALGGDEGGA